MSYEFGIVMDPIGSVNVKKDSSLAMLLAIQARGYAIHYMELEDLFLRDGEPYAYTRALALQPDLNASSSRWYTLAEPVVTPLRKLDAVLMRKDPPFNIEYIYATYLLERAEASGVLVVNKPQSLRDANEKLYTAWFPQCCPPTLVSSRQADLREFVREHGDVVVKPPEGMGGSSVFRIRDDDPNVNVILEILTAHGHRLAIAQRYLPAIREGDKRILLIDGEPVPYALARIPAAGETRGNLAVGATGKGVELSARDRWICQQVGPALRTKGLIFVGLDVIGEYLTEINVTSPTCIRELDRSYGLDIGAQLIDALVSRLETARVDA